MECELFGIESTEVLRERWRKWREKRRASALSRSAEVVEVCAAFTEWNDGPDRIFSDRLLNALHTLVEQQQ